MFKVGMNVYDRKLRLYGVVDRVKDFEIEVSYGNINIAYFSTGFFVADDHTPHSEPKVKRVYDVDRKRYFTKETDFEPRLKDARYIM